MLCFKLLVQVSSSTFISASKSECGIWATSNHINKYKKYQLLTASISQTTAKELDMKPSSCPKGLMQTWRVVVSIRPTVLTQVKQPQMSLLGLNACCKQTPTSPTLTLWCIQSRHQEALGVRGCTAGRPQHHRTWRGTWVLGCTWAVRLPRRTLLGGISTRRQCNTMTSPGRSSGREPRAVSFTSSVQGLTGQNPNVCSCTASRYPRQAAGRAKLCCLRAQGRRAARLRTTKFTWTKQNGGVWFWHSTQPPHWSRSD